MKKLRLLITEHCNRNCEGCCNKQWDLKKLPVFDFQTADEYKEIILTGGEPLLKDNLFQIIQNIRKNTDKNIYIYTAFVQNLDLFFIVLNYIDGITLTLHENKDIYNFKMINEFLIEYKIFFQSQSLRLNVFKEVDLPDLDLSMWKVKKDIVWIENCPLPQDEIFMRVEV